MELKIPEAELDVYVGFLDEAHDHLGSMETKILDLSIPVDVEAVNGIFRGLHSVKGVAAFLNLKDIQRLSHQLESVFDGIRQLQIAPSEFTIQACLAGADRLNGMIEALEQALSRRQMVGGKTFIIQLEDIPFEEEYLILEKVLKGETSSTGKIIPGITEKGVSNPLINAADNSTSQNAAYDDLEELITPEMRETFAREAEELIEGVEQVLLGMMENPLDDELCNLAFRHVHSLKGNAGFFGFADLEKLCHRFESALDISRKDRAEPNRRRLVQQGLNVMDTLKEALRMLKSGGSPSIPNLEQVLQAFPDPVFNEGFSPNINMAGDGFIDGTEGQGPKKLLGEMLLEEKVITSDQLQEALHEQSRPLGQILIDKGIADSGAIQNALIRQQNTTSTAVSNSNKEIKRDLRVDLVKLDTLLDLVGELVIASGMVINHPELKNGKIPELEKIFHQLQTVVGDLQSVALGVRMIPIEGVFKRMQRLVHDLGSKSGKKVRLRLEGEKTEVDKNVADLIADPIVHMIRNSVDHGLEGPEDRKNAGKDVTGTVSLEADQEGGEICIRISDDGRGLSRERILAKARERGMVQDDGSQLSDEDVFQFIFMPGFSTAESITSTSGRGVGMDVVKSNIDRLNGTIGIKSKAGQGSEISLRIPLTLSIIDGMLVKIGTHLLVIPLLSVCESISAVPSQIIRLGDRQKVLMLRGKSYPIIKLEQVHKLKGIERECHEGILLRVEAHGNSFCIRVDEILGQHQTVVKALPIFMGSIPGVSSCSILTSGEISLILDIPGVWNLYLNSLGKYEHAQSLIA